jgi:hypothetical protein
MSEELLSLDVMTDLENLKSVCVVFKELDDDRDEIVFQRGTEEASSKEVVSLICDTLNLTTREFAESIKVPVRTVEGWRSGKPPAALAKIRIGRWLERELAEREIKNNAQG